MKKTISVRNLKNETRENVHVNCEDICPICKHALSVNEIYGFIHDTKTSLDVLSLLCRCPHCGESYINQYTGYGNDYSRKVLSAPNRFEEKSFEEGIKILSPDFVEIYNQSLHAESLGLNRIAGVGYRKAVEFLIKDFAISNNPDNTEGIKSMFLSNCINTYIDNEKIKSLATKTVWLGNDETHYLRKHTDRDIDDLKNFIEAVVYFINIEIIYQDSETIAPM